MKALAVGNIISIFINGIIIISGINYLLTGNMTDALVALSIGAFFLWSHYYIYDCAKKGDNSKKKFQKTIGIIDIIFPLNFISGIICLATLKINYSLTKSQVNKTNDKIYKEVQVNERKPINDKKPERVYNSNVVPFEASKRDELKKTNKSKKTSTFYDEDALINDLFRHLETPMYIKHQLTDANKTKQEDTDSWISVSYSYGRDITSDSIKYKDSYKNKADYYPLKAYYILFSDLNEHQLNWYLYWRKEFLKGNVLETDLSYIYLFSYELINYTFNEKASFNVSVLDLLYRSYVEYYPKMYLDEWVLDMLFELGEQNILIEEELFIKTKLYAAIENPDGDKKKIGINIWRNHYSEENTDLSNKKLKYLQENSSRFYTKFKKYAGLIIEDCYNSGYNILDLWFEKKSMYKQRSLYRSAVVSFDRKEANMKFFVDVPTKNFYRDMNDITNLCYDFLVNDEFRFLDYQVDYPLELLDTFEKRVTKKTVSKPVLKVVPNPSAEVDKKTKPKIDISKIDVEAGNIKVSHESDLIKIEEMDKELFYLFANGFVDKVDVKKYAMKNKKLEKMLIADINKKYHSNVGQSIIVDEDQKYKLSIDYSRLVL